VKQIELVAFIPQLASYMIWYPKNFIINEAEDGIVSITSPITTSNLTFSSYSASRPLDESALQEFLQSVTEKYSPVAEIKSVVTRDRIWLEQEFKCENIYWIWWALAYSNRIIIASVNSDDVLSKEDRHLYTFMLDKMEIYSDDPD
jgi:hypothetical protein